MGRIRFDFFIIILTSFLVLAVLNGSWHSAVVLFSFFSGVALHELGHSVVANYYGIKLKKVNVGIFGGLRDTDEVLLGSWPELFEAIAGPAANAVLAMPALAMVLAYPGGVDWSNPLLVFGTVQAFFIAVNLFAVPIFDGYRIAFTLLMQSGRDIRNAAYACIIIYCMTAGGAFLIASLYFDQFKLVLLLLIIFSFAFIVFMNCINVVSSIFDADDIVADVFNRVFTKSVYVHMGCGDYIVIDSSEMFRFLISNMEDADSFILMRDMRYVTNALQSMTALSAGSNGVAHDQAS